MASLRGFPFKLLLLMARIRSPIWIAPVLQHQTGVGKVDTPDGGREVDTPNRAGKVDAIPVCFLG